MNDNTATVELAQTVNLERLQAAQAARSLRYREAVEADPKGVAAYEAQVEARRARPQG